MLSTLGRFRDLGVLSSQRPSQIVQYSIDILRVDCCLIWIDHLKEDERVVAQHLSFNLKVELQVGVSQLSKLELLQVDLDAKV